MNNEVKLKEVVQLPTEVAINIRNFFGKTTAALDEIGLQNVVGLENAIANAIIDPKKEKGLLEKVVDKEVDLPKKSPKAKENIDGDA
jgi:hypothetical protein